MMKRLFTLVELLAVIAIIAILASMTLGLIGYANKIAKEKKTTATMAKIEMALEEYKRDRGAYPNNNTNVAQKIWTEVFNINKETPAGSGIYVLRYKNLQTGLPLIPGLTDQKAFQDGWKQEFRYRFPAANSSHGGYELWSMGSDETDNDGSDTSDDITNWARR